MSTSTHKPETIPISALCVLSHKIGFKPVIACLTCQVQLDLNKASRTERQKFISLHELCVVTQERIPHD